MAPERTQELKMNKKRSSCNACSASKVRCNGSKGTCKRCVQRGIDCHYSFSKRMGRPSGSLLQRRRLSLSSVSGPEQLRNARETDQSLISSNNSPFSSASGDMNRAIEEELMAWSRSYGVVQPGGDCWSQAEPSSNLGAEVEVATERLWLEILAMDVQTRPDHETALPPATMISGLSTLPKLSAGFGQPSDSTELCQIIESLEIGSGALQDVASMSPDQILSLNRCVVKRLTSLVTGSTSHTPDLAFLYCSAFGRIFALYRMVVLRLAQHVPKSSVAKHSSITTDWTSNTEMSSSFQPNSPRCQGWMAPEYSASPELNPNPTPARMSLGSYEIEDAQLEVAIQRQILSSEATKLGHLIDSFVIFTACSEHASLDAEGVATLYDGLCTWLQGACAEVMSAMEGR